VKKHKLANSRLVQATDLIVGAVLRMTYSDGSVSAFSDCLIVKVDGENVGFVRPYATLEKSGKLTVSNELFTAPASKLIDCLAWKLLTNALEEPENFAR